jgi:hypothetical protein
MFLLKKNIWHLTKEKCYKGYCKNLKNSTFPFIDIKKITSF